MGTFFEKKKLQAAKLTSQQILDKAKEIDKKFNLKFPKTIPKLVAKDPWKEIINVCRGSFAVACVMAPPSKYPYTKKKHAPLKKLTATVKGQQLFDEIDRVAMQDAVLNIAILWQNIWDAFKKKKKKKKGKK